MAWCSHCGRNCDVSADYTTNSISCVDCGKILSDGVCYDSQRRTFQKEKVATSESIYKNMIKKSHATRQHKVFDGREMIWCPHCRRKGEASHDHDNGIIHCVDCGKILFEDIFTKKAALFKDAPGRKNKRKLTLDVKSTRHAQDTPESAGQLFAKKRLSLKINCDVLNTLFYDKKILKKPSNEDFIMENDEECYSTNEGCESSYYNKQESCDYSYDYDYEGGDEYDDY